MGKYLLILFSLLFLSVTGCGPSSTARDAEKQQENTYLRRQVDQMKNVEGTWVGCLTKFTAGKMPAADELNRMLVNATNEQRIANQKMTNAAIAMNRGRHGGKPSKPQPTDPPIPDMPPENPPPLKGAPSCKGGQIVYLKILVIYMLQADTSRNEVVEIPTLTGILSTPNTTSSNAVVVFTSGLYREEDQLIQLTSTTVFAPSSSAIAPTILQGQMNGNQLSGRYIAPQILANVTFNKVQ